MVQTPRGQSSKLKPGASNVQDPKIGTKTGSMSPKGFEAKHNPQRRVHQCLKAGSKVIIGGGLPIPGLIWSSGPGSRAGHRPSSD